VAEQSQSEAAADPFAKFVAEAAQWFGVPILWINAVMIRKAGEMCARVSPVGDGPYADHA